MNHHDRTTTLAAARAAARETRRDTRVALGALKRARGAPGTAATLLRTEARQYAATAAVHDAHSLTPAAWAANLAAKRRERAAALVEQGRIRSTKPDRPKPDPPLRLWQTYLDNIGGPAMRNIEPRHRRTWMIQAVRCTIADHLIAAGHASPVTNDVDKQVDATLHAHAPHQALRPLVNAYHRLART